MTTFFCETNFRTNVSLMYAALQTVTFTTRYICLYQLDRSSDFNWNEDWKYPTVAMHQPIIGNVSQMRANSNMCIVDWVRTVSLSLQVWSEENAKYLVVPVNVSLQSAHAISAHPNIAAYQRHSSCPPVTVSVKSFQFL